MKMEEILVDKGEDIKEKIIKVLSERGVNKAVILNAIGSAIDLVIAAPYENQLPLRAAEIPFHSAAEIIGLSGEVQPWSEIDPAIAAVYPDKSAPFFLHLHVAAASAGGHAFGGGLRGGKAFRSMRIFYYAI
jgi:Predicted DNA-binding protein with PD1-like DNA-binding motif